MYVSLGALVLWKKKATLYATYDTLLWVACKMKCRSTADFIIKIVKNKSTTYGKKPIFLRKVFYVTVLDIGFEGDFTAGKLVHIGYFLCFLLSNSFILVRRHLGVCRLEAITIFMMKLQEFPLF